MSGHVLPRGNAVRDGLANFVFAALFLAFLFSIARIGLSFVPSSTNLFWGLSYIILALSIASRPIIYFSLVSRNFLIVSAAIFAMASSLWSLTPSLSASRGALLVLNILVGFMLAHQLGLRRTIVLVFVFGLLAQIISAMLVVVNHYQAFDALGNVKGIYLHKNNYAQHSCLLYITGWVLLAARWHPKLSTAGILVAVLGVILSRSGTGLIMLVLLSAVLAACASLQIKKSAFKVLLGTGLIMFGAALGFILFSQTHLFDLMLVSLGKDSTLTGRTILWSEAIKSFKEHPLLGVGYFAFWNSPETTAVALRFNTSLYVQSFHNIYLDVLVDLGLLGLLLFVSGLLVALTRTLRRMIQIDSAFWVWPFVYCCFVVAYGVSEYPIFWNNEFQLLLAFAAAVSTPAVAARNATSRN